MRLGHAVKVAHVDHLHHAALCDTQVRDDLTKFHVISWLFPASPTVAMRAEYKHTNYNYVPYQKRASGGNPFQRQQHCEQQPNPCREFLPCCAKSRMFASLIVAMSVYDYRTTSSNLCAVCSELRYVSCSEDGTHFRLDLHPVPAGREKTGTS